MGCATNLTFGLKGIDRSRWKKTFFVTGSTFYDHITTYFDFETLVPLAKVREFFETPLRFESEWFFEEEYQERMRKMNAQDVEVVCTNIREHEFIVEMTLENYLVGLGIAELNPELLKEAGSRKMKTKMRSVQPPSLDGVTVLSSRPLEKKSVHVTFKAAYKDVLQDRGNYGDLLDFVENVEHTDCWCKIDLDY